MLRLLKGKHPHKIFWAAIFLGTLCATVYSLLELYMLVLNCALLKGTETLKILNETFLEDLQRSPSTELTPAEFNFLKCLFGKYLPDIVKASPDFHFTKAELLDIFKDSDISNERYYSSERVKEFLMELSSRLKQPHPEMRAEIALRLTQCSFTGVFNYADFAAYRKCEPAEARYDVISGKVLFPETPHPEIGQQIAGIEHALKKTVPLRVLPEIAARMFSKDLRALLLAVLESVVRELQRVGYREGLIEDPETSPEKVLQRLEKASLDVHRYIIVICRVMGDDVRALALQ